MVYSKLTGLYRGLVHDDTPEVPSLPHEQPHTPESLGGDDVQQEASKYQLT